MINDPDRLLEILPMFFGQTKYRSFRRQLNMWHFERLLVGPDKGAFVHPFFIRGNKALCSFMSRHINPRSALPISISFPALADTRSSAQLDVTANMALGSNFVGFSQSRDQNDTTAHPAAQSCLSKLLGKDADGGHSKVNILNSESISPNSSCIPPAEDT